LCVVQSEDYFMTADLGVFLYRDLAAQHAGEASTQVGDCRRDFLAGPWRAMPNRKRAIGASFAGHRWFRESAKDAGDRVVAVRSPKPGGTTPGQPASLKRRSPMPPASCRCAACAAPAPTWGASARCGAIPFRPATKYAVRVIFSGTRGMITWQDGIDSAAALDVVP
jgi:hypothetical protein